MVHGFLVRGNAEQNALDLLKDRAIKLASWRDWREFAKEANGASQEALETILVDELAQVFGAPGCGEDEHVAELSV